jgi:hypothetical protein
MSQVAYKFPDEAEDKKDGVQEAEAFEVEIVDDTPPEDRGREPLPENIKKELEEDDLEEYSEKVKKRLSQMKKIWHDERREKEAALREREEALRFVQAKDSEIKKLQQELGTGRQTYFDDISKATEAEISVAKDRVRQAYESGDPNLIADAQEALTDAKVKLQTLKFQRPALQVSEKEVEAQQQYQETRQVTDPKAEAWRSKNTWFGSDDEMTALALGLHNKLVRQGLDPRSDEYYSRVDETMRKRFPDYFDEESKEEPETRPVAKEKPEPRKAANVVAPATRSTAPRKVRLTQTQLALAKRLGLTPEAYAHEMLKLENNNG